MIVFDCVMILTDVCVMLLFLLMRCVSVCDLW